MAAASLVMRRVLRLLLRCTIASVAVGALIFVAAPRLVFDDYDDAAERLDRILDRGKPDGLDDREAKTLAAIALVSQEDRRIYERRGLGYTIPIDPRACLRSAWNNVRAGRVREGCSTLAMQLAKRATPNRPRRALGTKLMQMRLSWRSADRSPNTIVDAYLAALPCASTWAEGLDACALLRFGRPLERLSSAEIMVLASAVQAPGRDLQPTPASRSRAEARLGRVIDAAVAQGLIPAARADAIRAEPFAPSTPALDLVRAELAGRDVALTRALSAGVEAARTRAHEKQGHDRDLAIAAAIFDANGTTIASVGERGWFERPIEAGSWVKPFVVEALLQAGVGETYLAGDVRVPLRLPLYTRDLKPWHPRNAVELEPTPLQPMAHVMRSVNTGTLAALLYAFVYLPPADARRILDRHLSAAERRRFESATDRRLSLELASTYAGVPLSANDAPDLPGYRQITLGATRMALRAMRQRVPSLEVPHEDLAALLGVVRAPARDLADGLRTAWLTEQGTLSPLAQLMARYARGGTLGWLGRDTPLVYKTATADRNAGLAALLFDHCANEPRLVMFVSLRPSGKPITPVQGANLGRGIRALTGGCLRANFMDSDNLLRPRSAGSN